MAQWRKFARDAAVSLALGTVATVLVSWVIAMYAEPVRGTQTQGRTWPGGQRQNWRHAVTTPFVAEVRGVAVLRQWSAWGNSDGSSHGEFIVFVARSGFPLPAMESVLRETTPRSMVTRRGVYDNEGTVASGLRVPLHWTSPHAGGQEGWASRRLPLRPLPLGFLVNSVIAAAVMLPLVKAVCGGQTTRREGGARKRRRMIAKRVLAALVIGPLINIGTAWFLWARWEQLSPMLTLERGFARMSASEFGAVHFGERRASWPCGVPRDWRPSPRWIGWRGKSDGVRGYEYLNEGVPSSAMMWFHVFWNPGPNDRHQSVQVVQAGWPLPALQAEERITLSKDVQEDPGQFYYASAVHRKSVGPALAMPNVTRPTDKNSPTPNLPVRPLPIGFAVNTALFGMVAAFVLYSPGALRVWRRRRRGCCIACGYDVRGIETRCPECGVLCS